MSLPLFRPKPVPSRPATHTALDLMKLMGLGGEIEEGLNMAGADALDVALLEDLAGDLGVPISHLFAAAALTTQLPFAQGEGPTFTVCAGGCQRWGALPVLEALVAERARREQAGEPTFEIHAKRCLDQCDKAAVVAVQTDHGTGLLAEVTPASILEAAQLACEA
jgi:NADH:ubiquinone oxidoreductase subunit E